MAFYIYSGPHNVGESKAMRFMHALSFTSVILVCFVVFGTGLYTVSQLVLHK